MSPKMTRMVDAVNVAKNGFNAIILDTPCLVWGRLKQLAYDTKQTLYAIKHHLLDEYMVPQLKNLLYK